MRPPLILRLGRGGIRGSAVGGWEEVSQTYASSRDAALTGLKMFLCRNVGYSRRVPLVVMHGFGETVFTTFSLMTLRRYADMGFEVIAVEMRGRNGSSGTQDASGREICDIIDAVAWVRANVTGVDQDRCGFLGYSGGAGNAFAAACKFPTLFSFYVAHFGIVDYGYDATNGWYQQNATGRTSMDSWIGDHTNSTIVATAYRARNALESLPTTLQYSSQSRLYMLHDADDPTVAVTHSRALSSALTEAGVPHTYTETSAASASRALHEHPDPTSEVAELEYLWWRQLANAKPWAFPQTGSMRAIGYACFNAAGRDVEIWAGPSATPRTASDGGKTCVFDVTWDVVAATYTVTPLNGSCTVQVLQDDLTVEQTISSATVLQAA